MQFSGCLLDDLADGLNCLYLSELHNPFFTSRISALVSGIPAGRYSLEEWNRAVAYLTKEKKVFTQAEEARLYLVQYITK